MSLEVWLEKTEWQWLGEEPGTLVIFPEWEPLPNLSTFSLFSSFSLSSLLAVSPRTRIGVRFFWIAYTVKYLEIVPSCLWHLTASNGIWDHTAHLRTRLIYFKASSVHTAKHNSGDREFLPIACHSTGGLHTERTGCVLTELNSWIYSQHLENLPLQREAAPINWTPVSS